MIIDFIQYIGVEIGKHNYSIQVWAWDKVFRFLEAAKKFLPKTIPYIKKLTRWVSYAFVVIFTFNLLFIYMREWLAMKGCVMCNSVEYKIADIIKKETDQIIQN